MRVIPPIVGVFYLGAAGGLEYLLPNIRLISLPYHRIGLVLIGAGMVLAVWSVLLFKRARTPIDTFDTPTALVVDGPFRFSRSPMYVSLTVVLSGIAVYLGTLPWFLAPVAFALTMNASHIPREERNLERQFGQAYLDYKNRVRRWL